MDAPARQWWATGVLYGLAGKPYEHHYGPGDPFAYARGHQVGREARTLGLNADEVFMIHGQPFREATFTPLVPMPLRELQARTRKS